MASEKNIPGIISIEYIDKVSLSLASIMGTHPLANIDEIIDGMFESLEFVKGTASLQELSKSHPAGDYFEIQVPFRIAGVSQAKTQLLDTLRADDNIYRVVDQQGQGYVIGGSDVKVRLEYQTNNSDQPSGSRGYQCKITLKTTKGLIYCE